MAIDEHAQAAYDAFNSNRRGWRRMPPWELTLSSDREAWRAVARAVLDLSKERQADRPQAEVASIANAP